MAAIPAAPTLTLPPAAAPGDLLAQVDTPSLVLDLEAFESNLRAMQTWADRHGVNLRPHGKAHKCPEVALRQLALGAKGICCQKVSEALPFVEARERGSVIRVQMWRGRPRCSSLRRQIRPDSVPRMSTRAAII